VFDPASLDRNSSVPIFFDGDRDLLAFRRQTVGDFFAPFYERECAGGTEKLFAAGVEELFFAGKAIGVDMNEVKSAVVFGDNGIRGRNDGLYNAQPLGYAFCECCFSCPKLSLEGDDGSVGRSATNSPPYRKCSARMWA